MMKMQIRQGVFETNSSSMHSIVIRDNLNNESTPYITKEEALESLENSGININLDTIDLSKIDYDCREFNWGTDIFNDFSHKLCYAIAELNQKNLCDQFIEIISNFLNKPIIYPTTSDSYFVDISTHCDNVIIQDLSTIDHQSVGNLSEFLEVNNLSFLDFILNPDIILVIDNDNH